MNDKGKSLTALYLTALLVLSATVGMLSFTGVAAAANAGNVSVTDVQIADSAPHYADANVTVDVTLQNSGSNSATKRLRINSTSGYGYFRQVASKSVTVPAGTTKTVAVNVSFEDNGDETVSVAGQSASTITVNKNPVQVASYSYSTTTTQSGKSTTATITLENTGSSAQERIVELIDGYNTIASKTVTVAGGSTTTVSVSGTVTTPGVHAVRLENSNATKVNVSDPQLSVTGFSLGKTSTYTGTDVGVTATVNYTGTGSTQFVYSVWANGSWKYQQRTIFFGGSGEKSDTVDVSFWSPGTYGVQVNTAPEQTLTVEKATNVTGFDIDETAPYYTGENVTVNVTVVNRSPNSQNHFLSATGYQRRDSNWEYADSAYKSASLNGSETKHVTLTLRFSEAGKTRISLAGINKTIDVTQNPVRIQNVRVADTNISAGTSAQIDVTLNNTNASAVSRTVRLFDGRSYGGQRIAQRSVQVAGNSTKTISFTPTLTPGAHNLRVNQGNARKIVVRDSSLSISSVSLSSTSVYAGDTVTVTATLKNAGSTQSKFTTGVWKESEYDFDGERLVTGLKTTTLSAGETQQVTFSVTLREPGTTNITVNNASEKTVTVNKAVTSDVTLSDAVLSKGETGYVNVTLTNTIGSSRTKFIYLYAPPNSRGKQVTIPAGSTKTVSFPVSYSRVGSHSIYVSGVEKNIIVPNRTAGLANITIDEVFAPETVVKDNRGSSYVGVQLRNTGNASGVKNVTVSVGGSTVSQRVYLEAGATEFAYLPTAFPSTGEYTVTVETKAAGSYNDANVTSTRSVNVTVRKSVIQSVSIEHVGGTAPSELPTVSAQFQGGYVSLQAKTGAGFNFDLADIGADHTTRFRINLTVKKFTPSVLLSNGRGLDWETYPGPTQNTKKISLTVSPAQWDLKTRFNGSRPRAPSEWESSVEQNVADLGFESALFAALGTPQGDFLKSNVSATALRGMTISTDAQMFTMPRYISGTANQSARLTFGVAAPHLTVNGNLNNGYYRVFLPNSLLDEWNVSNPETALNASYSGSAKSLSINEVPGGAWANLTLHYSSGTVTVTADTTAPSADAGSDVAVTAGTSVQFDASGSTDNRRITSYKWDVDGDGTYEKTGVTASHTYSSVGTRTVTVKVTDAAGNTDTDTVTVTVKSATGGTSATNQQTQKPVEITRTTDAVRIRVRNPTDGMSFDLPTDRRGNVSATNITLGAAPSESFTLTVSTHATAPEGTPTPTAADVGGTPLGYLRIDHSVESSQLAPVTVRFRVDWGTLTGINATASDVVLYRYHDGEWQALNTTLVRYTDAGALLEATSPGLSVFAVGTTKTPTLSVTGTSLNATRIPTSGAVSVTATVENTGTGTGAVTVALSSGDTVRA
ncbi:MAG: PKD domain-containing protein, partial [Haloarculaceae archaeon]